MKLSELVGYFYYLWEAKSIWKKSKPWKQLSDVLETNSLTLMKVLKFFRKFFRSKYGRIECNANFKQWFNVFLIISEAWQGYDSKAYGVSNHNLKLQCKKFNRTRDIQNFPTQGWADTAFCTRKRSETYTYSKLLFWNFCWWWKSGHFKTLLVSKYRSSGWQSERKT